MLHLLTRFTRETFIFTKELNTHIHWDGTKKENEFGLYRSSQMDLDFYSCHIKQRKINIKEDTN